MDELFDTLKLPRTATLEEIRTAFREWKENQQEILKTGSREEQNRAATNITRISDLYKRLTQPESKVVFLQPRISIPKIPRAVEEEIEPKVESKSESKIEEKIEIPKKIQNEIQNEIPQETYKPRAKKLPEEKIETQDSPSQTSSTTRYKILAVLLAIALGTSAGYWIYSELMKTQSQFEKPVEQKIVEPTLEESEDQRDAIQSLLDFHSNITNQDYQSAYDCLSPRFKSSLDFDGWADGFKTTVSSSVSNLKIVSESSQKILVEYDLEAIDYPDVSSRFHGAATMIKTAEGWKIDDILNQPILD